MRGSWPHEIVRLLENWSDWIGNDKQAVGSSSPYPAYRLGGRGKRSGNVMPIIGIEAERADAIIRAMPERWAAPLRLHYRWNDTMRTDKSKADSCNCCVNTYKARLDRAHQMFSDAWYGRTSQAQSVDTFDDCA